MGELESKILVEGLPWMRSLREAFCFYRPCLFVKSKLNQFSKNKGGNYEKQKKNLDDCHYHYYAVAF